LIIYIFTDDWIQTNNKIKTKHGQRSIKLFKSCIHADLHDDNVIFNNQETMKAPLLDFVDIYYDSLFIQVSYNIISCCFIGKQFNDEYLKRAVKQIKLSNNDLVWHSL